MAICLVLPAGAWLPRPAPWAAVPTGRLLAKAEGRSQPASPCRLTLVLATIGARTSKQCTAHEPQTGRHRPSNCLGQTPYTPTSTAACLPLPAGACLPRPLWWATCPRRARCCTSTPRRTACWRRVTLSSSCHSHVRAAAALAVVHQWRTCLGPLDMGSCCPRLVNGPAPKLAKLPSELQMLGFPSVPNACICCLLHPAWHAATARLASLPFVST